MTLRTRLAVALVILAAAATAAVGLLAYVSTEQQLGSEIDSNLRDVAAYASSQPGRDGFGGGDGGRGAVQLQTVLIQRLDSNGSIQSSPSGVTVPVTDTDRALAARGSGQSYRTLDISGVPYRMLTTADDHGAVQVLRPLAESRAVLSDLRLRILLAAVLVVAAAAATGWLIARQVTHRLRALAQAAATVARTGRLDVPIRTEGRDETGQLARAFTAMLTALDRSQASQQRLIQDAGHELRTPLTSLQTNLEVLARHPDIDTARRQNILSDLHSETRELGTLVNELVELSLGGSNDPEPDIVALADAAERVIARARRRTGRTITLDADTSRAVVARGQLERALANLIDNATKFSASGGPIDVTIHQSQVTVHDHGPGLAPGDGSRIFERFYRSDQARQLPGSGLGLAIVADIINRAGGTVFADNDPSGGALIGFALPPLPPPPTTPTLL